ncbi:PSD1 and planctomycete cytochrome C domain-containing protein [Stieleria sp. TO1_6]|uniref:PSD1 and planctomycete cytochrome C domain-containing protein n=1 Tax=Stieleria tagensis TaxID=2956795 RepID=UPI00209A9C43|nr:PSD1 and planctomycete cytochrome C domain-containing protein [Stieleria tagensis]MCO8125445.1 PSD1 and planctomycete cytochrome C domain-containing protein [Stieleria tagensis]
MKRSNCIIGPVLIAIVLSSAVRAETQAKSEAFFENQIRPLLSKHCFECHNADKQEGGIRLDFRQALIDGGDSGAAIVPGQPESSLLIEAVRYEGLEMPPEAPLSPEEIAKLVRWVRQGAVWPESDAIAKPSLGDQDAIRKVADSHWAFAAIEMPPQPETSDPDWARTPIDKFVLAKLDTNGLTHSKPAKRTTLIRRAFNDLIGLPPTPQIIQSVFGQPSLHGKTYVEIVDGLLASDHYGERMARRWMDVARYADTRDFQAAADLRYPYAYTYRDWLIQAFNSDLPYDDFVRQQLAADFLTERDDDPNLAALGFLTVGPLYRNNLHERIADRVDVVTRGLMGLTGSCARCHDHKYDPLSIEDYYSLYGVFRDSVRPSEFPTIENPLGRTVSAELADQFQSALDAETSKLRDYEAGLADAAMEAFKASPTKYLQGYLELNITKAATIRGLISKNDLSEMAMTPIATNLDRFRKRASNASHPVFGPLVDLVAQPDKNFAEKKSTYLSQHGDALVTPVRVAVEQSNSRSDLVEQLGKVFEQSGSESDPNCAQIQQAIADPDGPFSITPRAASAASRLLGKGRQKLLKFQQAIADVQATHPGAPSKAMALAEADQFRPVFVMFRGDPSRRGPNVDRRFPEYFSAASGPTKFENGSGRLELAEEIVKAENPLTSRVIVNRIWRMHFGNGLVADAGDFGLRSEPPAQQELMDFLAASLVEKKWSLKWLHRTIMLSNTYRQSSSAMDPPTRDDGTSAVEIDAINQLLWHQNRRRLDFESMRDAMLAVAGTLDSSIGGRSVVLSANPHPTRRTLYAYVDRVDPDPLFATFDVPSADVSSAQRTETLVPQQALFAMNNPFVTEQARALIAHDDFQAAETDAQRIRILVDSVLQRDARPNEIAMIKSFVNHADRLRGGQPVRWQYGFGRVGGATADFKPLTHFDGKRYSYESEFPSPVLGYAMLSSSGGHPGKNSEQATIRRWTAPADMLIRIAGTLERKSERGDGVRAVIRINGKPIFETTLVTGQSKTACGIHSVKTGDSIDFVVDPLQSSTADGHRWTVLIEHRDETKKNVLETWSSGRDFSGPPPPPLSPWEQTAQALMMTNEFLFVD